MSYVFPNGIETNTVSADSGTVVTVRDQLDVTSTVTSSSPSSGALVVTGGVGVGENLYVNGPTIDMGNNVVNNVNDPLVPKDAANKKYVDLLASGINAIASVKVAANDVNSSIDINLPPSMIDGVPLNNNDRVLVNDQGTSGTPPAVNNGIYIFNGSGTPLTRATDLLSGANAGGLFVLVEDGNVNAGTGFVQTAADFSNDVVGTDALLWTKFSQTTLQGLSSVLDQNNTTDGYDINLNGGSSIVSSSQPVNIVPESGQNLNVTTSPGGIIDLNAGDEGLLVSNNNITFENASVSPNITFNNNNVSLNQSLPQDVVGALNQLQSNITTSSSRISYTLNNVEVRVKNTSFTNVGFVPYDFSLLSSFSTVAIKLFVDFNSSSDALNFQVEDSQGPLTINTIAPGSLSSPPAVDASDLSSPNGIGVVVVNIDAPSSDDLISLKLSKSGSGAPFVKVKGVVVEFS